MFKNIIWQQPDGGYSVTQSSDQKNGFPVDRNNDNIIIFEDSMTYAATMLSLEIIPANYTVIATDVDPSPYLITPVPPVPPQS